MLNEIDLSRIDLNLLVVFEAVFAARHVGQAAERLNLTASAVSHGLGRLRRLLDDPLFLKSPKGVVPTARALELAEPVGEILARIRAVVATAAPFDPATSTRRFTIGAPDATAAVLLAPLLAALKRDAPGIGVSLRQGLPRPGTNDTARAWEPVLAALDARDLDIAVVPPDATPARFAGRVLYEEAFVIAGRRGHPYFDAPGLVRFCAMRHLVVSLDGDPYGFVDSALAEKGLSRHVAVTVPNFMLALAVLAEGDLIAALPGSLVAMHGERFGLVAAPPPLALPVYAMRAIVPKVALMDAGVAWLYAQLAGPKPAPARRSRPA